MTFAGRFGGVLKPSGVIFDVDGKQKRITDLEHKASDPDFWSDAERSKSVLKQKGLLERSLIDFSELVRGIDDAETLFELGREMDDEASQAEAVALLEVLEPKVRASEVHQMLAEEFDNTDAIVDINSGAGGTDAADWAAILKRMYLAWALREGFKAVVVDEQLHEEAGIKSCRIEMRGPYAYGYMKAEIGVHRLVRISPFDSNARRHTAFASVDVVPDIEEDINIVVRDVDIRIDVMRASGAGGQSVNTTDSAVRITHLESGIVVNCRDERSQTKNKAKAMKILKARLYQREEARRQAEIDLVNSTKKRIEWGSQIRSYVLQPYQMVKDLRTGHEMGNASRVLDGDLTPFMEAWLVQRSGEGGDSGPVSDVE